MSTPIAPCASCGLALPSDAAFCPRCGTRAGATPAAPAAPATRPWLTAALAAAAVLAAFGIVVWRGSAVPREARAAAAASAAAEEAPDISGLTPAERFDRLYDRAMRALQTGDSAAVDRFAPMALGAYEMLDSPDSGARRRVALLRLHLGDTTALDLLPGRDERRGTRAPPLAPGTGGR